ncbi:MAG: YfhO family protein [Thermoanaerobaculia bacterium]
MTPTFLDALNPTFLYVALVWLAAVWLWRRLGGTFPWKIAIFFYLLVLVFLFRPMTQAYVNVPVDYLFRLDPWRLFHPGVEPQNGELNDLPLQIIPWAHQVRESWKALEVPLWNPSAAGGYPLLANGQSSAFSLVRWIALPLELDRSLTAEAALKLLIALGGAFLFLRRRGYSDAASVIAAVSFAFSTAIVVWLHFPIATGAVWLPAVFLAIDMLVERRSYKRFLLMTLVFAQLLFSGHPETAAHTVFGAGVWLLFVVFAEGRAGRTWKKRLAPIGAICGAGFLAFVLALPQILPLFEALPSTKRWEMLEAYPGMNVHETDARFFVNFIQPAFFGTVREGTAWGPAHAELVASYGGMFLGIAWVGVLAWTVSRRRWRDERFLAVAFVPVLMAIALNWPGISDLFEAIPPFSFAANARLRLLVIWFAALAAAALVDLFLAGVRWPLATGAGAMAAALAAAFLLNPVDPSTDPFHWAVMTSIPGALVIVASAAAALVPGRARRAAVGVLLVLATIDLWAQDAPFNLRVRRALFYPRTPILTRMMEIQARGAAGDPVIYRITGTNGMLFPNTAVLYGLHDIRGHDPMANGRVLGVLRVFTGYTSDNYFGMLRDVSHPVIDYLNVAYVLTGPQEHLPADSWEQVYAAPDGRIYRNREVMPRFFAVDRVISEFDDAKRTDLLLEHQDWRDTAIAKRLPTQVMRYAHADILTPRPPDVPKTTVRLTRAAGDVFEMEIDASRWTLIVSSQPDWPGWRVVRNGAEQLKTIKVNAGFMGFIVPPGHASIRVYYAPRSFWVGAAISLVAFAALAAAGILLRLRSRRASRSAPL